MKILFLDIDGVLNCETTPGSGQRKLDPTKLALLDEVLKRTGAFVVISSAWRAGDGGEQVRLRLGDAGLKYADRIIDETPRCWFDEDSKIVVSPKRGVEVGAWLTEHPEITTFAIVDDGEDFGSLSRYLVRTTWKYGMEPQHAKGLIKRLGEVNDEAVRG